MQLQQAIVHPALFCSSQGNDPEVSHPDTGFHGKVLTVLEPQPTNWPMWLSSVHLFLAVFVSSLSVENIPESWKINYD